MKIFLELLVFILADIVLATTSETGDFIVPCDHDLPHIYYNCDDGVTCIENHHVCDGIVHCPDGSDEKPYTSLTTIGEGYECTVKSTLNKCILPYRYVCNTPDNCLGDKFSQCSPRRRWYVTSGIRCTGDVSDKYKCDDGVTCIPKHDLCDGWKDCPDGSDEKPHTELSTAEDGYKCTVKFTSDKCILPHIDECDFEKYCDEDECICSTAVRLSCPAPNFVIEDLLRRSRSSWCHPSYPLYECDDGYCIENRFLCDGMANCMDNSDEKLYTSLTTVKDGFECTVKSTLKKCILPHRYVCDSVVHCLEDECNCSGKVSFKCSTNECTPSTHFCNGQEDCNNGRDELIYRNRSRGFRCTSGHTKRTCVLPFEHVCDGYTHCNTMGDECFCEKGEESSYYNEFCFRCLDGQGAIATPFLCNEYFDCADLSDECLCSDPISTCKQLTYKDDCEFQCRTPPNVNTIEKCIMKSQVCDGSRDCFLGEDEKYCSLVEAQMKKLISAYNKPMPEFACCNAGYPVNCLSDEVFTTETDDGCDQFFECELDECYADCNDSISRPYCHSHQYSQSKILECLLPFQICDGNPACNPENPQDSSDEINCSERHYCTAIIDSQKLISIPKSYVCDCIKHCGDGSDESNCTEFSNFCCNNGEGVDKNSTCNGIEDCSDGSDECLPRCIKSPFADDKHLISNVALRAFVWIFGLVSSGGNIYVLTHTSLRVYREKLHSQSKITSFHLIALSSADLCVGIYLISLGAVNAAYDGVYCYKDKAWRSGKYCNVMGVISMFGLQASVFILTLMTVSRLYAILRFEKNPFVQRDVNRRQLSDFANKLASYDTFNTSFQSYLGEPQSVYPWHNLFDLMHRLNETFTPQFKFGYYSSHGVCLAKLFPDTDEPMWQYSMMLISINFVSFLTILISYILIYRQSAKTRKAVTSHQLKNKQSQRICRKITQIIVTDFCCWIPICVVAFFKIAGIPVSDEMYAIAAVVVLPINSAVNPFIYSNLPEVIWSRIKKTYNNVHITAIEMAPVNTAKPN